MKGMNILKKQLCFIGICILLCGCSMEEVKEGSGTYTNDKGEVTTVKVKMKNKSISEISIDETAKGKDKTKKELGDEYHMKEASPIQKEWKSQIEYLESYIVKQGVDKITLNKEGKAENNDIVSGCTIQIDGFLKAIEEATTNAK